MLTHAESIPPALAPRLIERLQEANKLIYCRISYSIEESVLLMPTHFADRVNAPVLAYQTSSGLIFGIYHPDYFELCVKSGDLIVSQSGNEILLLPLNNKPNSSSLIMRMGKVPLGDGRWQPEGLIACCRLDLLLASYEQEALAQTLAASPSEARPLPKEFL